MARNLNRDELEKELGQHLLELRLARNLGQRELAERAAVAWSVVKNLEAGKGSTITSLIKVLRALGREEWLNTLAPVVSISPLQMLKSRTARQRVFKPRRARRV